MADEYLPIRLDDNARILHGHGSELYTKRFTAIGTGGQAITLPVDCKSYMIHQEGSGVVMHITGNATGSTVAYITSDGSTLGGVDCVVKADTELLTVAAPSGTINVSVFAWR